MEFEFTAQEQALLVTLLAERQREMLHEIARAESHEFRRELQDRETMLEALLRKLATDPKKGVAA